jgi:hypothetical protein
MDTLKLCRATMAAQQIVSVAALIFDNILTQHKIRVEKKLKSEVAPYKCNHSMNFWLQTVLEPVLDGLLVDNNLKYTKKSLTCTPGSSSFLLDA